MPQLAISKDFLTEYAKLEKPVQRAVREAITRFGEDHGRPGLNLEKLARARDPRVRTIRIDRFWRGVVLAPSTGDVFCLLRVLPHDDAIAFAVNHRFSVNQALGVLESRDESVMETMEPVLRRAAETTPERLFDGVKDSELKTLGIDGEILPVIRLLTSELHLEALRPLLPTLQYDALAGLASGMSVEEVWADISRNLVEAPAERVDPDDIALAIERSPGQLRLVEGPEELATILDHPFALWRTFLHPAQQKIAYRESYSGPAMVTGGAGTGKTVTALHRTAHLAGRYTPGERATPPILLTSFTNPLVSALRDQLGLLVEDAETRSLVDVRNIDKVAAQVFQEALGRQPNPLNTTELGELWEKWETELGTGYSGRFLVEEWEQVVLTQEITTEEEYLNCSRKGRRERLAAADRARVWRAVSTLAERTRTEGVWSFRGVVAEAGDILRREGRHLYEHVVVDEAQDLDPVRWRLVRAAVPRRPDDLFIAGDPHQRIYEYPVSLAAVGINVRGRSRRLTVNYRTTHETLTWALKILGMEPAVGMDDVPDRLDGQDAYHSPMHGRWPIVRTFPDEAAELDGLAEQVRTWLRSGVEPESIGVATRKNDLAARVRERLEKAGARTGTPNAQGEAIKVGAMHAMKGLEFRCMAVVGVTEELVPLPRAVTPAEEDRAAHEADMQIERCLLFVACTRARDQVYVSHSGAPSPFLPR